MQTGRGGTLSVFFEDKFALFRFIFVFASSTVLASFAFIFRLLLLVEGLMEKGKRTMMKSIKVSRLRIN